MQLRVEKVEKLLLTCDTLAGPFSRTPSRAKHVDFSTKISIEYSTIVMPLSLKTDVWSVAHPFEYEVWIASLAIIPIFILAMGLAGMVARWLKPSF